MDTMQDETLAGQAVQEPVVGMAHEGEVLPMGAAEPSELEQVKGERDQLLDRLARLQAEFDNARKRETRERADARDYTITNTVEPFLGVMDNFNLALKADGTAEQLRGGVELILKQMEDALKGLNVQPVESIGTQFDPRVHEALGNIETLEFRITRYSRRFDADTRFVTSCCARRWCGSRPIRDKYRNKAGSRQ